MNERIKLPDQEWLGYDPERGDIHGYTFEQMREFAELIVQHCMLLADLPKNASRQWNHLEASEVIAAHFGIK